MSGGAIVVAATGVQAVFERHGDRWGHRIEWVKDANQPMLIMDSLEGARDEDWPPSPAIQELHCQSQADGTVAAMGVGMSGRSHWSLSCRAIVHENTRRGGLMFHLACRLSGSFPRIGSCYRIVPECSVRELDKGIEYRSGRAEWTVASNSEMILDANHVLRMAILGIDEQYGPRTYEWGYGIQSR